MRDDCKLCGTRLHRLLHLLIPPLRAYIRYAPSRLGKRRLWTTLLGPQLARHSHAFTSRTVYGPRLRGNQVTIMPRCIYYFGVWEVPLSEWIADTLGEGDTFVDVGANMGYFTLLGASRVGRTGSVVALEPSPNTFAKLQVNLALAGVTNVRAVQVAAGGAEGTLPFHSAPWNDAESSTAPVAKLERDGDVAVMPLERVLTEEELGRVRVVKVDVEGAEGDVLTGLVPALERTRRELEVAVEVHPNLLEEQGKSLSDIVAMMERAGFTAYWLPVDFSALGHLEPARGIRPSRGDLPKDRLVHVIFSRRRAPEL